MQYLYGHCVDVIIVNQRTCKDNQTFLPTGESIICSKVMRFRSLFCATCTLRRNPKKSMSNVFSSTTGIFPPEWFGLRLYKSNTVACYSIVNFRIKYVVGDITFLFVPLIACSAHCCTTYTLSIQ